MLDILLGQGFFPKFGQPKMTVLSVQQEFFITLGHRGTFLLLQREESRVVLSCFIVR